MKNNTVKSEEEIKLIRKSGEITSLALKKVRENVRPGITCRKLDDIAKKEIERLGGKSSFMTVEDYKFTICTTINDQVVHGIPGDRKLANGDIIGIDIGAMYKGYHTDLAISIPVGTVDANTQKFLEVGQKTLKNAIDKAVSGNKIGDISSTIQSGIEGAGYSVVKELTGHGVGRELHEQPYIPGFGKPHTGPLLLENMTLAIEVIYTLGSGKIKLENDNWTISSADGTLGGLFEQTVKISKSKPVVLTPYV